MQRREENNLCSHCEGAFWSFYSAHKRNWIHAIQYNLKNNKNGNKWAFPVSCRFAWKLNYTFLGRWIYSGMPYIIGADAAHDTLWLKTPKTEMEVWCDYFLSDLSLPESLSTVHLSLRGIFRKIRWRILKAKWTSYFTCWLLSHVRLFVTLWTIAHQAPLSMEFSQHEYWSGLPFSSLGDLPNPGIETRSSALQADSSPSEPPKKPHYLVISCNRQPA